MKRFTLILFTLFIASATAQEKTFKEFYKTHKEEAELSLNIPGFIANIFIDSQDDDELELLLSKSSNYKILICENNSDVILKNFKKFVKHNNLKTLVKIKDGKDRVEVHFREDNNLIREIIVNVMSHDNESVLIGLKTKLTKEELSEIISSSSVQISSN